VVFQSELAAEHFGIDDVIGSICDKMLRRHPHVFGDETAKNSGAVKERWEEIKAKEKQDRGVLDGIPVAMPALLRAQRAGEKAAHLGLDWKDVQGPREKLDEELGELDQAVASGDRAEIEAELGDVLFSVVSLGRKLGVDPEAALRRTLDRFGARVRFVEVSARERGLHPAKLPFEELDDLWKHAKEALRASRE
jgi:MazG family protein